MTLILLCPRRHNSDLEIGPKSRTERPRKTTINSAVADKPRDAFVQMQ